MGFWKNYSLMAGPIKRKAEKEIEKIEKLTGTNMSSVQRKTIRENITKQFRKNAAIGGIWVATILMSVGATHKVDGLLTDANYSGIETEVDKFGYKNVEIDLNKVDNVNVKSDFDNSLKVNINNLKVIEEANDEYSSFMKRAKTESYNLYNPDKKESENKVLDYIKNMYLNDYNQKNNTNYNLDDLKLTKCRDSVFFYRDTAENGDNIVRVKENNEFDLNNPGMTNAVIDGKLIDSVTNYNNEFVNVYSKDEKVEKSQNINPIMELMDRGIDYYVAIEEYKKGNTDRSVLNEYNDRFVKSMVNYTLKDAYKKIDGSSLNISKDDGERE